MVQSTGDHLVSYYQALDYYISKKSTADIIFKKKPKANTGSSSECEANKIKRSGKKGLSRLSKKFLIRTSSQVLDTEYS